MEPIKQIAEKNKIPVNTPLANLNTNTVGFYGKAKDFKANFAKLKQQLQCQN